MTQLTKLWKKKNKNLLKKQKRKQINKAKKPRRKEKGVAYFLGVKIASVFNFRKLLLTVLLTKYFLCGFLYLLTYSDLAEGKEVVLKKKNNI